MNSIAVALFCVVAFLTGVFIGNSLMPKRAVVPCKSCADCIVSAALDEEGWVLLGSDGETRPWPEEWPVEVDSEFFARRGWHPVDLGSPGHPKEGWLAP